MTCLSSLQIHIGYRRRHMVPVWGCGDLSMDLSVSTVPVCGTVAGGYLNLE